MTEWALVDDDAPVGGGRSVVVLRPPGCWPAWGRRCRTDPEEADWEVANEIAATADAVARLVRPHLDGPVAVIGDGIVAQAVRWRLELGAEAATLEDSPVIVDTTGEPGPLDEALRGAPKLGIIVLAVPPVTSPLLARTYADIHVRGLTVVGCPWAGETGQANPELADRLLTRHASVGDETAPLWYSRRA